MSTRRGCLAAAVVGLLATSVGAEARGFSPALYFRGTTRSEGVVTDSSGRPTSRLAGLTRGGRDRDGATVFDQTIRFDDGTERSRRWRIVQTGPHSFEATGTDVIGVAHGTILGNTLHLVSTIRLQDWNPLSNLDFDQVMSLRPDGRTLDNHSTVTKLGFLVRRIDEVFVKRSARAKR